MRNQWRAMTVRMISAQNDGLTASTAGNAHTPVQKLKEDAYAALSRQVVTFGTALLRDVDEEDAKTRSAELTALFERAGKLACQLQSQYVQTRVLVSYQEMGNFSVDSNIMEAHTTMDIEQDDHSWDGKPIDLVITPAVLAFGNERGENYSSFKVWSKAVVWMEERQVPKSRGNGLISSKGKSSGGPSINEKAGASRMTIWIPDDDVKQSTTRTAEGIGEDVTESGETRHLLRRLGQTEQHAKRKTRSSFNNEQPSGPRAAQNDSNDDMKRWSIGVFVPSNGESSKSIKINDYRAEQTKLLTTEFQSQKRESANAPRKDAKPMREKAGSSKKRDWNDDDYSESVFPRPTKRWG
jgi:hypothetical protein